MKLNDPNDPTNQEIGAALMAMGRQITEILARKDEFMTPEEKEDLATYIAEAAKGPVTWFIIQKAAKDIATALSKTELLPGALSKAVEEAQKIEENDLR